MDVQVDSIASTILKYNEPHTTESSSTSPPLDEIPGTSPKNDTQEQELPAMEPLSTPPPTGPPKTPPQNTTTSSNKSTKKRKALVALYQSELSPSQGIKICIKKSDTTSTALDISKKRKTKRSRKQKNRDLEDSDDSKYEKKRRKDKSNNNNTIKETVEDDDVNDDTKEQSNWGSTIPEEVLCKIFEYVIESEGPLPTLCRFARVCSLWNRVSLIQKLWSSVDLGTSIKEKFRTELKLKWFIDNRISQCTDLNVAHWKVSDVTCVLAKIAYGCKNLKSLTLTGWKGFSSENFKFISEEMPNLSSLDISAINVEMNTSKSAIGLQSLCDAIKTMNGRLTNLHLAHNRLAGMPQIIEALANFCPNLAELDLSNVRTVAHSHGIIHIEKLQAGCQKLKVLRLTNSYVNLSTCTLQEQMESPGFPDLEELSVAVIGDGRIINDEFLQRILKTSSKLKLLDIRGCARLTHESLIRCPAWDLRHLFLSGCQEMTRDIGSGLELIASKWSHSLIELDLAWANVQKPVDNALKALAEKGVECPISHLNLCGSSVSVEAVREVLIKCPNIKSINLSSCRGLPRGVKRLMSGAAELQELREAINISEND